MRNTEIDPLIKAYLANPTPFNRRQLEILLNQELTALQRESIESALDAPPAWIPR